MIAYLAVPFAFGDLGSVNSAMQTIAKHTALFMKHNKGSVMVNPLFNVYNSDQKTKLFSEQEFYAHAKVLIDSANAMIVLQHENWDYSEVTRNELGYAYFKQKPVHFLEPVIDDKQDVQRDNGNSPANGV